MAITPIKALLFLLGGSAAAAGTAYVAGVFDPYLAPPPPVAAVQPESPGADAKGDRVDAPPAGDATQPPAQIAAIDPSAPEAEAAPPAAPDDGAAAPDAAAAGPVVPSFDIVRLEPDGSLLVAGRAAPGAKVELIAAAAVIGTTTATGNGDFTLVLDTPLKPGDYQLSLRATATDNSVSDSVQAAILSVPETPQGEVLAMVEEPGKPTEIITAPEPQPVPPPAEAAAPAAPAEAAAPAEPAAPTAPPAEAAVPPSGEPAPDAGVAAAPPAGEQPPAQEEAAAQPAGEEQPQTEAAAPSAPEEPQTEAAATPPAAPEPAEVKPAPVPGPAVIVEAVEIEGSRIFVAGAADPGRRVRGYANEWLLGDAVASPDGRFLIDAVRDLPVGDYIIRIDALDKDGATVVSRAAVPFEREPGESIAAVAPPAPPPAAAAPAPEQPAPPATAEASAAPPAIAEAPAVAAETPAQPPAVAEAPAQPQEPATGEAAATPPPAAAEAPVAQGEVEIAAAPEAEPAPPANPPAAGGVTAPKLQAVDSAVIIRRGDTLWRISRRVYGRGIRYSTIYLANQTQIADPDRIWPGQVFRVPDKSEAGESADLTRMGDQVTTVPEGEPAQAQ